MESKTVTQVTGESQMNRTVCAQMKGSEEIGNQKVGP